MLNWLKRKTRVSFNSRYINILGRSNSPEMFLTEQSMLNQQQQPHNESRKIIIYNGEGEEYTLDVPLEMTLDRVKLMAIGHFYNPLAAVGENPNEEPMDGEGSARMSNQGNRYRLVLARNYRTLPEERSVAAEELCDNDEIILLECRKPKSDQTLLNDRIPYEEVFVDEIKRQTEHLLPRNINRQADPINSNLDFKVALRQILITMIEASIHLITPEENACDLFVLVFEQLEKRHKPRVDKASLKQLTEMGFTEANAIKALRIKRNVLEAMEWLLDETNKQRSPTEGENDILLLPPERRKSYFMSGNDPAEKVMQEFQKYVEKWFVADAKALQNLVAHGYGEDLAKEALRISCNNENLATEFLEGKTNLGESFQRGFQRDSPIMSAILDSPIVQVALSKPKTLFALMVLCETPSNVNVWLSDPETHPVVSQVLRIYHAEKHRLTTTEPNVNTSGDESDSGCHSNSGNAGCHGNNGNADVEPYGTIDATMFEDARSTPRVESIASDRVEGETSFSSPQGSDSSPTNPPTQGRNIDSITPKLLDEDMELGPEDNYDAM